MIAQPVQARPAKTSAAEPVITVNMLLQESIKPGVVWPGHGHCLSLTAANTEIRTADHRRSAVRQAFAERPDLQCKPITRRTAVTQVLTPKLVAPWEGTTVMMFGVRFSYKVVSADSGGSLAVLEVEIPAGTLVKPHNHSREDEFSLVLSGTVGARIGDRVLAAGPGTYLVKPRGTPHAMWNAGSVPAKVAEILSPAGLEGYFEELAPILAQHRTPPEYYQLAENYGITIQDDWIEDLERTYGVKL